MRTFNVKVAPGASGTLIDTGLLTLTGTCSAGGVHGVTLTTDSGAPSMAGGFSSASTGENTVSNLGYYSLPASVNLSTTGVGSVIHGEVSTITGMTVTIDMLGRDASNFASHENVCIFSGTVMFN